MPIYEYECENGHRTERLRRYDERNAPIVCRTCHASARPVVSRSHCAPDGVYSYAPNVGNEAQFARRLDAMKEGKRIIPKDA